MGVLRGGIRAHNLLLTSADVLTNSSIELAVFSGRFESYMAASTANNKDDITCVGSCKLKFLVGADLRRFDQSARRILDFS